MVEKSDDIIRFDYIDTFYMANTLTTPQLRYEIQQARETIMERNIILSMPCCLLWSHEHQHLNLDDITVMLTELEVYDYEGYIKICQEAIAAKHTAPSKPSPGKRIDINSLKSRLDIVTEVERYTQLRKSGSNRFLGRCPLHEDRHPSMTVYADKQSWHCFQCNKGGDVIDFIIAVEGVDFRQAAAILGGT